MIPDFKPNLSENIPDKKPASHKHQSTDWLHKSEMRENHLNKYKN